MSIITSIVIGGLAGWLAGKIMKKSSGLLFNIILGIAGGFIGGFMLGIIGLSSHGLLGNVVSATIGASLLIYIGRNLKKD